MSSWLEIQKNLVESRDLILEVEVETITYTRIGGYKATPYSLPQGLLSLPMARSLKGVWRWWARVALVGARGGRVNYVDINKYLDRILGGTGKGEGVSSYRLEISDVRLPNNFEESLKKTRTDIDGFYNDAKDFVLRWRTILPQPLRKDTTVRVSVNPSNCEIIIENNRIKLTNYKKEIDEAIRQTRLQKYHPEGKLSRDHRYRSELKIGELNNSSLRNYAEIPRVKLLLMKRQNEEEDGLREDNVDSEKILRYLSRVKEEMAVIASVGMKFKISLYWNRDSYTNKDPNEVNFAISSLVLSLILGGIGSFTKRAFGSLRLISYRFGDNSKIKPELTQVISKLKNGEFKEGELAKTLEDLCRITTNLARNLLNVNSNFEYREIPEVPSLSNIRIEDIECRSLDLAGIGNATLKQTWKSNPWKQGRDLHTWILGLPRFQQETGYAIKNKNTGAYDPLRRVSSIGIRCFKSNNKSFIIVFGLISRDWNHEKLLHIRSGHGLSGENREMPVVNTETGKSLANVYNRAFEMIMEVLRSVCKG